MHDWGKAATVTSYSDSLRFEALAETEGMGTGPGGSRNEWELLNCRFRETVYVFELHS